MDQMWGTRGVRGELQGFGLSNWKAGYSPAGGGESTGREDSGGAGGENSGCQFWTCYFGMPLDY